MSEARRKNIAVLFGGRSVEHEISVITALQLIEALDVTRYNLTPVYIAQSGRWYTGEALLERAFYHGLPGALSRLREVTLLPVPGVGGLVERGGASETVIPVDVCIPAFHGEYGEDGCIQGLLELAALPYTSSSVIASAMAMDKYACKMFLQEHGVPVLPCALVRKRDAQRDLAGVRAAIKSTPGLESFPLFVKPVHLGSSIGVGRASDDRTLDAALANALKYDDVAIVERCVSQIMEINVSVRMTKSGPLASVVEIPVASGGFLSYEDKYQRGGKSKGESRSQGMASLTRMIDPSDLDVRYKEEVRRLAVLSYRALQCFGIVRFDFIVDLQDGSLAFNELNPLPGSFSFYLWEKSHPPVLYTELIDELIENALERSREKLSLVHDTGFKVLGR